MIIIACCNLCVEHNYRWWATKRTRMYAYTYWKFWTTYNKSRYEFYHAADNLKLLFFFFFFFSTSSTKVGRVDASFFCFLINLHSWARFIDEKIARTVYVSRPSVKDFIKFVYESTRPNRNFNEPFIVSPWILSRNGARVRVIGAIAQGPAMW